MYPSPQVDPIFRAAHRLDFETSGLVLIAKTTSTLKFIHTMFASREISKNYLAFVQGDPENPKATIRSFINNKEAVSSYEVIKSIESNKYGRIHIIKFSLITGRTHQLRIHSSNIASGILGDKKYNMHPTTIKGMFLHAYHLNFHHPISKTSLTIESQWPKKFERFMSWSDAKSYM